jgi:hypothetical protein
MRKLNKMGKFWVLLVALVFVLTPALVSAQDSRPVVVGAGTGTQETAASTVGGGAAAGGAVSPAVVGGVVAGAALIAVIAIAASQDDDSTTSHGTPAHH